MQFLLLGLTFHSDGNIRYFELENDKFEFLSEYKSGDPQRGVAFMPKRGVNMHENEIARAYKTINDSYIEPISFIVPRRSENFQDDIYPPTVGLTPAMGPSEWLSGKEAIPPKISMASLYDGQGLKEVSGVQDKPTGAMDAPEPKPAAEPVAKKPEPVAPKAAPEPVSEPTPAARPAPSMKEQGGAMAAMVNKFADEEDESEPAEDDSSFEEVSKPAERVTRSAVAESTSPRVSSPLRPKEPESRPEPRAAVCESSPHRDIRVLTITRPLLLLPPRASRACPPLQPTVTSKRLKTLLPSRPRRLPRRPSRCRP